MNGIKIRISNAFEGTKAVFSNIIKKLKTVLSKRKFKRFIKRTMLSMVVLGLAVLIGTLIINAHVKSTAAEKIISAEEAASLEDVDCILVLGCGVWGDSPSTLLKDRLNKGIDLQKLGVSEKLLMSGDHGKVNYNEVSVMKQFAIDREVLSQDVFMDHAGFSTYESMYRAKEIFGAKKIVIVTQEYHLSRAVYIANSLGMEAYGVAADFRQYSAQTAWDIREILARVKDYFYCAAKPLPTYLGESIDLSGSGDITNDEYDDFQITTY